MNDFPLVFSGQGIICATEPGWLAVWMNVPAMDCLSPESFEKDKVIGGLFEGRGFFPVGSFQIVDNANKTAAPDFAGEPRVVRCIAGGRRLAMFKKIGQ